MMKHEFEDLTGITVTDEEYNKIENSYMSSVLNKQQWCKQYIQKLNYKKTASAPYKKELKYLLKDAIENWETECMDEDTVITIKYNDGSMIIFSYEYEGKKPSVQNIENIYYSDASNSMDFYYDWIGDKEIWEIWNESGFDIPKRPLILDCMDEYFKKFEQVHGLRGVA